MTTTLRPTGPLQRQPDGGRARAYDICDNGRPVGAVALATVPGAAWAGTVRELRIDDAERRRGRGKVAALAAEEVLRGWECTEVRIAVPSSATAAGRLASALGYTERSRNLAKRLTGEPPALPPGTVGRPMTEGEFEHWSRHQGEGYARSWVAHGLTLGQARAKMEADRAALLPDGAATPGVHLETLEHEGVSVGTLWLGRREVLPGEPGLYVYDVEVAGARRGEGHGRSLMLLAERCASAAGTRLIGLHVFADNTPALGLYTALGYRTTAVNSAKRLL